eukprot:g13207.t1
MNRLDLLTTAVYPHDDAAIIGKSEDAPPFELTSLANITPVAVATARLSMHVFQPYVILGLFALAGLGIASVYSVAAGAALLAHLCLFGESVRISECLSHLPPGLHCSRSARTDAVVAMVPSLQYPHYKGTPWLIGGDVATLYPFVTFDPALVRYARRWLTVEADNTRKNGIGGNCGVSDKSSDSLDGFTDCGVSSAAHVEEDNRVEADADDKEAVALDIALPESGLDPAKPFYIFLHGLTGGSNSGYALDFVSSTLKRGCGVCVMVARGCMGTPVRGSNFFHAARTADVKATVHALRRSLPEETPLALVGYSVGGIIALNYAAMSGVDSGLSCCVSISGSFDARTNSEYRHSQRVWQPMLSRDMKEYYVLKNIRAIVERGLDISSIERCKNILEIDTHLMAPYNGYADVASYYWGMSAAGGKVAGLRTPTLAVSSLDDPIMNPDGAPIDEVKNIEGLFILLTRKGGHVGWPTGWLPGRKKWDWMNKTSLGFCEAIVATADMRWAASCDGLYPHDELESESMENEDDPPRFTLTSAANVVPVLVGIARLSVHVFRPYVVIGLFVLAALGVASVYCVAVGATLLAHLCLFDERFRESERLSHLPPGLHYSRSARTDAVVAMVPVLRFPHYKGTPWIFGGDLATLYPFLAFRLPHVSYARRWLTVDADDTRKNGGGGGGGGSSRLETSERNGRNGRNGGGSHESSDSLDGVTDCGASSTADCGGGEEGERGKADADDKEAVALDIALPEKGLDPAKPFYLVLHGLTGGSAEPYVLDFVWHTLKRDCGVCVMVTRGCMGTPVRGANLFHGARVTDVKSTVKALRRSLPEETPLAMVGYSMGGIIAMNYASIAGADSGVSCCVSMSGSFDVRTNMYSRHSQRVWQPMLVMGLKEHFVLENTRKLVGRGLDVPTIERCENVLDIDTHMVAPFNGYPDVASYYFDMSAAAGGKITGLRTPTLAVSSLDDPIMTAGGSPVSELNIENLFILLTRNGGHVGWPTGWLPNRNNMSKNEKSLPCNTGRAAAMQAILECQLWRNLIGDEEEALELALPEATLGEKVEKGNNNAEQITHEQTARDESRTQERSFLEVSTKEREETAEKAESEADEMTCCDEEDDQGMLHRPALVVGSAESETNVPGELVTQNTVITTDNEQRQVVVETTGAESTPLRAAAVSTPVLLPAPVPTPHSLRMFLGVLKHNPAGVIREVGVLLMLHVASIEVAVAAGAAAAEKPSALLSSVDGRARSRPGRKGFQPQTKQRRDSAHLERRAQEAAAVLALALSAEKRRAGHSEARGATVARLTKNNKTRFQHQLRQPVKVEDRLQAWAATRGREVTALKELLVLSGEGELGAGSADARLALTEAFDVLNYISSATGAVAQDCANVTDSATAADAPEGPVRLFPNGGRDEPSAVGVPLNPSPGDPVVLESSASSSARETDERVEDASRDSPSSGDPVLWESPPSNPAVGSDSDAGIEDGFSDSRLFPSGDLAIWESSSSSLSSSSDLTPDSEQFAEDASPQSLTSDEPVVRESWSSGSTKTSEESAGEAFPSPCSSGDPVIWEPSSSDSTPSPVIWESTSSGSTQGSQRCVEEPASPGSLPSDNPFTWEASTMMSCTSTTSLCDEDDGELAPDLARRIKYYRSRLERLVEQELLAQSGPPGEVSLLSSSSSAGAGGATSAAVIAAVKERTIELSNGGGAPPINDDDILASDVEAREQTATKAKCLSGPSEDVAVADLYEADAVECPSSSSNRASVTIWETSTSETDSEKLHAAVAGPADNVTSAATLEGQALECTMPSQWLADPLEMNRDPLGDISLVSDDGDDNLWDDMLNEQLAKCPPVQPRATRRRRSNIQAGGDHPSTEVTSADPSIVTGDLEDGGEERTKEEEKVVVEEEEEEEEGRRFDGGERDPEGGGDGKEGEDRVRKGVPCESSPITLNLESNGPSFGLLTETLHLQHLEQQEQQEHQEWQHDEQTAVELSLAPQYALLLNKACGSMLKAIQGASVDSSVVRAVDTAVAAASAAQAAVSEAMALLDKDIATFPSDTKSTNMLQRSVPLSSLSSSIAEEVVAAPAPWGAKNSSLPYERQGEGGGECKPCPPEGGSGGGEVTHLSRNFNVDVGGWNTSEPGVGGGGMTKDAQRIQVLTEGKQAGQEACLLTGKWGVASHDGYSAGGKSAFGTAALLRCGKPWGSVVTESKLSIQWHVEKTPGNIGGSLAQFLRRIERREERKERARRAPELEEIRKRKLAAREQNGGLSPRPGLIGRSWEFPSVTSTPPPRVPSPTTLPWSRSTTSPSSTSTARTPSRGSTDGLGHTRDEDGSLLATSSTSPAEDAAATDPAMEAYRLSEKHIELTERWPAGLLTASKALIAEVPG